ncbi:BMP and activin membrane-bound inhibitor homolog [Cephus cinctus]|uniref:BMP and activin membrane-bound inhibitor homolog n=1 Tax=Cephus cinctus TaxID=211228 RepID=A0AAJ7BSK4_CEPCN|nr:BMP and activin membrane-bound inhibitor homolog [Cephus cinctus]
MLPRELITLATITTLTVATSSASIDLDLADYEMLTEATGKSVNDGSRDVQEVRCYCNQPECVAQGYLCRGRGCFTELPLRSNPLLHSEHGCLEESFKERQCPAGYLCCEQDLCNHVDSPAMRNRLNKTLQVLSGDQRAYSGSTVQHHSNHGSQNTDGWFKTATIAVPICGLIVLLILASLAIRLLQPLPSQGDKLGPHRTPDNGPPLLGNPKVPLV